MIFEGFKEAARAYKLARRIGMIGQHCVRTCSTCGVVAPTYLFDREMWKATPAFTYCDYASENPTREHTFGEEIWLDNSVSPLSCGDGLFFACVDGGYPVIFYSRDGGSFCHRCASDPDVAQLWDDYNRISDVDTYLEGPVIYCDHCNSEIESAYGDPDDPEND